MKKAVQLRHFVIYLLYMYFYGGVVMPAIPRIFAGDILEMKKPHPCSPKSVQFRVMRVGSDIRIVCENCGRDLTLPRIKLEKSIRRVLHEDGSVD